MSGLFNRLFGSRTESDIEARLIPIVHMMMVDGDMGPREMELLAAHTASIGVSADRFQRVLERAKSDGPRSRCRLHPSRSLKCSRPPPP
ncbi:MAG: hypothetical protein RIS86_533 [Planctomycetota bacterium]